MSNRKNNPESTEQVEITKTPEQAAEESPSEVVIESVPVPDTSTVISPGPRIYLGPNLPGGRLLQSTVFQGDVPKYLLPLLDGSPDVAALIVPVSDMSVIQGRIIKAGTPEYAAYQRLLKGETTNGN